MIGTSKALIRLWHIQDAINVSCHEWKIEILDQDENDHVALHLLSSLVLPEFRHIHCRKVGLYSLGGSGLPF